MRVRFLALFFLAFAALTPLSHALTMNELRAMPGLTPTRFAKLFSTFAYKFHAEVQPHDIFLTTKSGDCDDFATVAAEVLEHDGYTPRMIAIRMKGETHVVCYIAEEQGYLDYNTRKDKYPIVPCRPDITAIATKVAAGFGRDWVATYEFTYSPKEDLKRLVNNIIPNPSVSNVANVAKNLNAEARYGAKR
ncbi:MAG TPA: hypothetical protein VHB20_08125 [Verrucomicrobiae bacterium]|nr:hypothetical protein [Verrucomicrobiae bacterium]